MRVYQGIKGFVVQSWNTKGETVYWAYVYKRQLIPQYFTDRQRAIDYVRDN